MEIRRAHGRLGAASRCSAFRTCVLGALALPATSRSRGWAWSKRRRTCRRHCCGRPFSLILIVGFGTKVGLVPCRHVVAGCAQPGAGIDLRASVLGVETTTVLYVILVCSPVIGVAHQGLDARPWFITFGLISVGIATLLLIYVRDFKRMFGFSTVEHMGMILVAAGLGGAEAHLGAAYR